MSSLFSGERRIRLWLSLALLTGLGLRLALTPVGAFRADVRIFEDWAAQFVRVSPADFYVSARSSDHLPGDLWFLWAIAHLYHRFSPDMDVQGFGFLFLLKLVPAVADTGIGLVLFLIARLLAGPRAGLFAAAGFLFNPASIFLTAIWGQWDPVSAFFMAIAVWFLLRGTPEWSPPFLTYAALIKPQSAALAPLVVLAWLRWTFFRPAGTSLDLPAPRGHRLLRAALGVAAAPIVFLAVDLPFNVGVPPLSTRWTIVDRIELALDRFQTTSENAFNLWGVLAHAGGSRSVADGETFLLGMSYRQWGDGLLVLAMLTLLGLFWRRPSRAMALWAAFATTFSLFMLPTRVHERYLFPAVVLAVLGAAVVPALRWIAALLSLTYLVNLVMVYAVLGQAEVRLGATWTDGIVLATSTINLFLLLAVFMVGLNLSRSRSPARALVRGRWQAASGAVAAAVLFVALVTGAARDEGMRTANGFGAPTRGERNPSRPSSERPPSR